MTEQSVGRTARGLFGSSVELTSIVDHQVTAVLATVDKADGSTLQATGSARLAPGDKFNARVGLDLATARALRSLADKVEREHRRNGTLTVKPKAVDISAITPDRLSSLVSNLATEKKPVAPSFPNGSVIHSDMVGLTRVKVADTWYVVQNGEGDLVPSAEIKSDADAQRILGSTMYTLIPPTYLPKGVTVHHPEGPRRREGEYWSKDSDVDGWTYHSGHLKPVASICTDSSMLSELAEGYIIYRTYPEIQLVKAAH